MAKLNEKPLPIINMHEAKTQLSRLVEKAMQGEPFIIAKAGKPMVKVTRIEEPRPIRRLGFLAGEFVVPDDFDTMFSEEIERMFNGEEEVNNEGDKSA